MEGMWERRAALQGQGWRRLGHGDPVDRRAFGRLSCGQAHV